LRTPRTAPYWLIIFTAVLIGLFLFVWDLGFIGLVDETPPLFAASARAMVHSGDWLIPHVNGLPRYDKPPLVYWLMAVLYSLPAHGSWDPLGSWAAALPSALASTAVVVLLSLITAWWERCVLRQPQGLWLAVALFFGLGPLVMIWSRIGVSDSLLTALVAFALVSSWWILVHQRFPWWVCWFLLGLAILTKGPVALVLFAITWIAYGLIQQNLRLIWHQLKVGRGLLLSLAIAAPWYLLATWREGAAFLNSFFGYHNLQRFTEVVNRHQSPWWFYGAMLLLASLPWSGLVLLGGWRVLRTSHKPIEPIQSLPLFALCWLLSVLLLFSLSATKLPSYWLPATPAAALLAMSALIHRDRQLLWCLRFGALCGLLLGMLLVCFKLWLPLISDPDLQGLQAYLTASSLPFTAATPLLIGACLCLLLTLKSRNSLLPWPVFALQASFLALLPLLFWPLLRLGDIRRQQPMRTLALQSRSLQSTPAPIAMLGVIRPSFHFYADAPVAYEGTSAQALVNLNDRLYSESRMKLPDQANNILVVAPLTITERKHWSPLLGPLIREEGRYGLWSLNLRDLSRRAQGLQRRQGLMPNWMEPRPERF